MDKHPNPTATAALMAYPEAQAYLGGVSRSTLKGLIGKGQIRSVQIGRRRLLPLSELERFVAARLAEETAI